MKFPLFWLVVMLLADMCRASEEILARRRREVIVSTTTTKTAVPASAVDIFVRSEGCNDPGKAPDTCGIAYIKVNGKDHSLHGRGIKRLSL
ncbi:hypothetical protein OS493_038048 [Desmophyllum pertusum]|uniref:Uncharacterized protein n=1 Tax=Desmophyllum pertusum TaxID=174260 RepID=A0A9W9ZWR3_9CNID|nr:hypothetical protein OS493_038048 [Desmophyllum pertusum]